VVIILRESLDLIASFFAGSSAARCRPTTSTVPQAVGEPVLSSIDTLLLYNEVKLIVSYPEVIAILKDHHRDRGPGVRRLLRVFRGSAARPLRRPRLPRAASRGVPAVLVGTTGAKKGVKISTKALLSQVRAYADFVRFAPGDRVVSWLPHYHDMG